METNQAQKIDDLTTSMTSLHQSVQGLAATASNALDLGDLRTELANVSARAVKLAKEQEILGSLRFKAMSARVSKIQEAHGDSFSWIFNPKCDAGFAEWLRSDQGVYWISGKPGSGKSTLMKYLYGEQRTKEALRTWAGDAKLVTAGFFFWSVGTPMQKSQEGLLRSLLFEILRQCPDLIATACPERWTFKPHATVEQQGWDLSELSEVISRLFTHAPESTKFCFFIDGLDEYDGHHRDVIRVLDSLASSTQHVKMCVSSRPWNVFEDAYGRDKSRKLYLEDLTRGDIEKYVRSKLEEHTEVALYSIEEESYDELIADIVEKAEGVFLWVYLVVHSLCEGLTNGDDVFLLQERVRRLPSDLEHYFRLILESVEVEYRQNMARTFQVALQATEPLTLIAHSFLDERDPNFAIKSEIKAFDNNEIYVRHEKTKRRIRGRYKNLLHVSREDSAINFLGYRVDFFHRTVHDFLRLKEIQALLIGYLNSEEQRLPKSTGYALSSTYSVDRFGVLHRDLRHNLSKEPLPPKRPFNSDIALCKIYLVLMKSMPWDKSKSARRGLFQELLDSFMHHARHAEMETDQASNELLDELENTIMNLSDSNPSILWDRTTTDEYKKNKTFLELAVRSGLCRYVDELLEDDPHHLSRAPRPLLNSALRFSPSLVDPEHEMPDMVRLLLQRGSNPNEWYDYGPVCTVFGHYLHAICYDKEGRSRLSTIPSVIYQRQEMLDLLLSHKANPNVLYSESTSRSSTGFRPSEGIVVWGQLVMSMYKLHVSKSTIQAYLDVLKMFFRYGANPNLIFDDVRQETVWGSFLRCMYNTKEVTGSEGHIRLRYEMTKAFLLHGADLDIFLYFRGVGEISVHEAISQIFAPAEKIALEGIMSLNLSHKDRTRCCNFGTRQLTWMYRAVNNSFWQLATSIRTKRDLRRTSRTTRFEPTQGDDDLVFRIGSSSARTIQQSCVLSCAVILNNHKYKLQIPESAVLCSYRCGKVPGAVTVRITARYDDSEFGTIEFGARNIQELEAEMQAQDPQEWTSTKAPGKVDDPDDGDTALPSPSRQSGRIVFEVRPRSKPDLKLNQSAQVNPPGGTEHRVWLMNKLRSRTPTELSEALELLLYALNKASEVDLWIGLPRASDVDTFVAFVKAVSSHPEEAT